MTRDDQDRPEPTPAQRRRNRERAEARALILSSARDVARRDGWDAVTMRRLADEIEYSANFAYRYFTGRDDILLALVREGFARLRDAMETAATHAGPGPVGAPTAGTSGTAVAAVRGAAHAYLDFAMAEPDLYQLMYGLGGVRVPATDAWDEGQAVGDLLTGLLATAGDAQPERHVLQLWATAHGLIALLVVGRVVVDADGLHALLEDALTDCLTRVLPGAQTPGQIPDPTQGTPQSP
ncbi:TetR/AcrR family transcriptional regulator [Streptomyces shenzhenensis]|uniref:TetR/AcrR family transcriptional regulator n=1 Tax=Streptomyces shenzhenensis TaxID=943815 RepID=UPI003681B04A